MVPKLSSLTRTQRPQSRILPDPVATKLQPTAPLCVQDGRQEALELGRQMLETGSVLVLFSKGSLRHVEAFVAFPLQEVP